MKLNSYMPRLHMYILVLLIAFSVNTYGQDLKSAIRLTRSEQFSAAAEMLNQLIGLTPENGDLYYYY